MSPALIRTVDGFNFLFFFIKKCIHARKFHVRGCFGGIWCSELNQFAPAVEHDVPLHRAGGGCEYSYTTS